MLTPSDRFGVDYTLRHTPDGWRTSEIVVAGVSLAKNFRSQFDAAVEKDSFQGLLAMVAAPGQGS
jgi:ABC-type transporter MlaC component